MTFRSSGLLIRLLLSFEKPQLNTWQDVGKWNDACDLPYSYGLCLTGCTNTSALWNLCFSYMQSNWFTPLNTCQVYDVQPSITVQKQLRLIESWCSSAGPQGVFGCQHLQPGRERAEKPVSLLDRFREPSLTQLESPCLILATQIQFGFGDWTTLSVYPYTVLSKSKVSIRRCGHISNWLVKFQKGNQVIPKSRGLCEGRKYWSGFSHDDQQKASWFNTCASSA